MGGKTKLVVLIVLIGLLLAVILRAFPSTRGEISVADPGIRLQLTSTFRTYTLDADDPRMSLRPGRYRLKSILISRKADGAAEAWAIRSRGPFGELETIDVRSDETTRIEVGPPLVLSAVPQQQHSTVYFDLKYVGRSGEEYERVVRKGRAVAALPSFDIVSEKGEVLTSGKFEYG